MTYVVQGLVGFYFTRLRRNYPGYFREFRPFLIAAALAAGADFLSTWTFMAAGAGFPATLVSCGAGRVRVELGRPTTPHGTRQRLFRVQGHPHDPSCPWRLTWA